MRFRQFREIQPIPLQLAPMIDVLFLLLLFFIITWNSARRETEIEISVPAADKGETPKRRAISEIVVNVRKGGEIFVEGEKLTEEQLLAKLQTIVQAFNQDQAVILRGDEKSEYQKVMNVLNTCQKAGIWNVSFATRPPEQDGAPAPPAPAPMP